MDDQNQNPQSQPSTTPHPLVSPRPTVNLSVANPVNQNGQPKSRNNHNLILIMVIVLVLIAGLGSAYVLYIHKPKTVNDTKSVLPTSEPNKATGTISGYEAALQKFITAMQTGDKTIADSLQTAAFTKTIQQAAGSSDGSFFDLCKSEGAVCIDAFAKSYLASGAETTQAYVTSDGTKGYEIDYTIRTSSSNSNANGTDSGNSTNIVSFDSIPVNGVWLIDNFNETSDASATGNFN